MHPPQGFSITCLARRISIKWGSATTVASVIIKEASGFEGRIGSWTLTNHSTGEVLASGSGAGTINFDSVSLTKRNFNINSSSVTPAVAEFETYASASTTNDTSATKRINLSAAYASQAVTLSWSLNNVSPWLQEIYRDTNANPQGRNRIGYASTATTFTDSSVSEGVTYYYWIKATESDWTVTNSSAASVTIPSTSTTTGTKVSSVEELLTALASATAGATIYVSGGTYYFSDTIELYASGTQSQLITLSKDPSDSTRPLFDFSAMSENSSNRGLMLRGDYGHIDGIDVRKAGDNGLYISGSNNKDGSRGAGDGNGFKTGGSDGKDLKHNAIYINTIAAGNAVDGYDHNSNRGEVTIHNAIAYSNGKNINFSSTNPAARLAIKNTISLGASDSLKASSRDIAANSWQNGHTATAADFASVNIDELLKPRKADGSLPDVNFFTLVNGSDLIDAGVNVGLPYKGSAPDIGAFESK